TPSSPAASGATLDSSSNLASTGVLDSMNLASPAGAKPPPGGGGGGGPLGPCGAPTANADSYSVIHDRILTVASRGVISNDTDPCGQYLRAVLVTNVTHGTLSLKPSGALTYTPTAAYVGSDSFTYYAINGSGLTSNTVTVTISVTNNAPSAANVTYGNQFNRTGTVFAPGVLKTATDADADPLTAVLVSNPTHGTLSLNALGSFTYTPNTNWSGLDTFTYKVNDGAANSANAVVTMNTHMNDGPPITFADTYTVIHDRPLSVAAYGVLANAQDTDRDPLPAILTTAPTHGALTLNSDGSFTYLPNLHFVGADTFWYTANDGLLNANNPSQVTITVTNNNGGGPPTA